MTVANVASEIIPMGRPEEKIVSLVPELAKDRNLSPKMEQAVRYYVAKAATIKETCDVCKVEEGTFRQALATDAAKALINEISHDLDRKFNALYEKTITVLTDALDHPEPSVALAAANMFLRTNKAQKVEVTLTAEDVVQKLMNGETV